jgi:hypothetical protein
VACIVGPLFYRRWYSREPIDKKFVNAIIEKVLQQAATKARRR